MNFWKWLTSDTAPAIIQQAPSIITRGDVESFCKSVGYDTDSEAAKERKEWRGQAMSVQRGIDDVMQLLPEKRARLERKPRSKCQISVNFTPCPNPGHIYTEEWHGFATQGTIKKFHCFEHFDSVGYHDHFGGFRSRYLVIGERTAYDGITEAIRARGLDSRSAAHQWMYSAEGQREINKPSTIMPGETKQFNATFVVGDHANGQ